jgi:hypothetical protein
MGGSIRRVVDLYAISDELEVIKAHLVELSTRKEFARMTLLATLTTAARVPVSDRGTVSMIEDRDTRPIGLRAVDEGRRATAARDCSCRSRPWWPRLPRRIARAGSRTASPTLRLCGVQLSPSHIGSSLVVAAASG